MPVKPKAEPAPKVESPIFVVRGERVILDADLATVLGATTKRLNEQVKRNKDRFPEDFCFRLTIKEWKDFLAIRSQNATASIAGEPFVCGRGITPGRGGITSPYARISENVSSVKLRTTG